MNSRSLRSLLVILTLVLSAGLYFAPSQVNSKPEIIPSEVKNTSDMQMLALIETAKKSIKDEQLGYINGLEGILSTDTSNLDLYDSLGKAWDEAQIPAIAAWYFERKALKQPTEENYLAAAYRYFDAFKIAADSLLKSEMVGKAIASYEQVLKINPENQNAKTDLGVCYAEGTAEPMKGIMMLREVVTQNPKHEMAQLNLGFLSVKSGQFDKAIDRFTTVMQNNENRKDVYYFLGHTYYEAGKNDSALYWLEKFTKESDDYQLVQQAGMLIKRIKS